jgi:hypothetical protein
MLPAHEQQEARRSNIYTQTCVCVYDSGHPLVVIMSPAISKPVSWVLSKTGKSS